MKTHSNLTLHPVLALASINLILLIILVLIVCSSFSKPSSLEIRLPKALVSEGLQGDYTISITAENVLYFNKKAVTFNELKKNLSRLDFKNQNIFIQADRRSSMGRVMDIWDLCRAMGGSRVHILAGQEE